MCNVQLPESSKSPEDLCKCFLWNLKTDILWCLYVEQFKSRKIACSAQMHLCWNLWRNCWIFANWQWENVWFCGALTWVKSWTSNKVSLESFMIKNNQTKKKTIFLNKIYVLICKLYTVLYRLVQVICRCGRNSWWQFLLFMGWNIIGGENQE